MEILKAGLNYVTGSVNEKEFNEIVFKSKLLGPDEKIVQTSIQFLNRSVTYDFQKKYGRELFTRRLKQTLEKVDNPVQYWCKFALRNSFIIAYLHTSKDDTELIKLYEELLRRLLQCNLMKVMTTMRELAENKAIAKATLEGIFKMATNQLPCYQSRREDCEVAFNLFLFHFLVRSTFFKDENLSLNFFCSGGSMKLLFDTSIWMFI
jgi:hypothetical protein